MIDLEQIKFSGIEGELFHVSGSRKGRLEIQPTGGVTLGCDEPDRRWSKPAPSPGGGKIELANDRLDIEPSDDLAWNDMDRGQPGAVRQSFDPKPWLPEQEDEDLRQGPP